MIERLFVRATGEHRLFREGERVLAAVSGGADSVALLRLLHAHAARLGISLRVAHVNHGLRAEHSDRDEQFVLSLSASLGLECDAMAAPAGLRGEAALRSARHRLLRESGRRAGCDRIALGHTMDDQAETILMRLLRGAGRRGLSGMLAAGPGPLVRPMLWMRRDEVRAWLASIGQPFREDASNVEPRYLRNRVRAELLPVLEGLSPSAIPALARAASLLREEDRFLDAMAGEWVAGQATALPGEPPGVPVASLAALDPVVGRRVVRLLLERAGSDPRGQSASAVRAILRLASEGGQMEARDLAGGMSVLRDGGRLRFVRRGSPPGINGGCNTIAPFNVDLPIPGRAILPGPSPVMKLEARLVDARVPDPFEGGSHVYLDADSLGPLAVVRTRQPGDRFHPLGAGGSCRLKEFLIDLKVPRSQRDSIPLVEGPKGIAWVVGKRAGEPYRVRQTTRRIVLLTFGPSGQEPRFMPRSPGV